MDKSVLDANPTVDCYDESDNRSASGEFAATNAEPGSREKLDILADRIRQGMPLWHPEDRHVEDELLQRQLSASANAACVATSDDGQLQ